MKKPVTIEKLFVLSLLLTKMSCRHTGVSRNLDRRTRAFCCALRIHVSQSCSNRDRRHLHVSRYSRAPCPETDRRFSRWVSRDFHAGRSVSGMICFVISNSSYFFVMRRSEPLRGLKSRACPLSPRGENLPGRHWRCCPRGNPSATLSVFLRCLRQEPRRPVRVR